MENLTFKVKYLSYVTKGASKIPFDEAKEKAIRSVDNIQASYKHTYLIACDAVDYFIESHNTNESTNSIGKCVSIILGLWFKLNPNHDPKDTVEVCLDEFLKAHGVDIKDLIEQRKIKIKEQSPINIEVRQFDPNHPPKELPQEVVEVLKKFIESNKQNSGSFTYDQNTGEIKHLDSDCLSQVLPDDVAEQVKIMLTQDTHDPSRKIH
ncbi:hypothetical protein F7U66_11115 [Vibrio parahaemolyticus]|nr:hypothetical protein [Vibrio parahaemolyticus]